MRPVHFLYRKTSSDVPPIADMTKFRTEVLTAFASQIMIIEAFWTSAASREATFEPGDDLFAKGALSTGHGTASREVLVERGQYLVSLGGLSAASTTDPLPPHRSPRSASIEEDIHDAFAMQLDRVMTILVERAGGKPKRDGPAIRDALARHIEPALQLYAKTGPDADRDGQVGEHLKRLAQNGRTKFQRLFSDPAGAEKELRVPQPLRPGNMRDLLTEETVSLLEREPDSNVQRELVILIVLAQMRALAKTVHDGHKFMRQEANESPLKGQSVEYCPEHNRYSAGVAHVISERPHQMLPTLEAIAAIGFRNSALYEPFLFLLLAIEVASRYEIDILKLFPSRASFRTVTQAAIAVARCRRRGIIPTQGSHHAYFAYWGLRSMLDNEKRLEPMREHIRPAFLGIPMPLVNFALSNERPVYDISASEVYTN
jgi:hypothetical protein